MKKNKTDKKAALRFVLSLVRRHVPDVTGGILLLMAVELIRLNIPRIVQWTVDPQGIYRHLYALQFAIRQ